MQLSSKQIIEAAMNGKGGSGTLVSATARSNTYSSPLKYNLGIRGSAELMAIDQEDPSLLTVLNDGHYKIDVNIPQGRNSSSGGVTTAKITRIDKDGVEEELGDDSLGANNWSSAILIVNAWGFLNAGDKLRVDYTVNGTNIQHQPSLTLTTVAGTDSTLLPPVIHSGKLVSATFRTTAPEAFPVILDGPATGTVGLASPKEGGGLTVETTGEYEVEVLLDRLRAASSGSLDFSANLKVNGTIYDSTTVRIINTSSRYIKLVYGGLLKAGDVITVDGVESAATNAGGPSLITLKTVVDGESTHLRDYPYQGNDHENAEFPVGCVIQAWMPELYNDRTKLWTHHTLYCWSGTTAVYLTEERTETKGPKLNGVWAFVGEVADIANKTTGNFLRIR